MTADFYCMLCRCVFDGESFPQHHCGRITCAACGVNMPVTVFHGHPCIVEAFSVEKSSTVERPAAVRLMRPFEAGRASRIPPTGDARPDHPSKGA